MWRLTKLFSLVLLVILLAHGQEVEGKFSIKVKVIDRIVEEKPRLSPPDELKLEEEEESFRDLSYKLLEPPKEIETPKLKVPKFKSKGCGLPKDQSNFLKGLKLYKEGRYKESLKYLRNVIAVPNTPLRGQAQYIMGLVYSKTLREEKALKLFKESCKGNHPYRSYACESFYALYFKLKGEPKKAEDFELWEKVYRIKKKKEMEKPSCEETVFRVYCSYVVDFVEGRENRRFPVSTKLRRAILLIDRGELEEAREILEELNDPSSPYRSIVVYYLAVLAYKENRTEDLYRYANLLEILEPEYAEDLYRLLSVKVQDPIFARLVSRKLEGEEGKEALIRAGVYAYNKGDYRTAYIQFEKAGEHLYAAFASLKEGDYERAYMSLRKVPQERRDEEFYRWYLEVLYWLGKDKEMEKVLREIKDKYPETYRRYKGWLAFRRGKWIEAYKNFEDPYHRALALFNARRYSEVLKELKDVKTYKERMLKAKSAIALGNGKLARKFLTDKTPEEIYLKGLSYFIEGRYREAIEHFKKLLKDKDYRVKALLKIADSHYNMGNYGRAKKIYKEILLKFPNSKEAKDAVLALAQIELQRPSRDIKVLAREFERRFPRSPFVEDLRFQLASVYIKEGKKEEAKRILRKLTNSKRYKAKALLKLAELEDNMRKKELLLKRAIKVGNREEKEKATVMLMALYLKTGRYEKLADFLAKGDFEDKKKALNIYLEENINKAIKLFDELMKENPQDEELKELALKMYENTKARKYLFFAKESLNPRTKVRALYLLGLTERNRNREKALEYFVEIILRYKDQPTYYNKSILRAAEILVSMNARKDAACLLKDINLNYLSEKEIKRVKILKSRLPECEVEKDGNRS